ncbi:DUF2846 domain-containing protein [Cupriavidus plantarum]|nr:DUF2846 domain-containing protein [Cupriavidus plantarum]
MSAGIPAIRSGEGRVYFYRDGLFFGGALRPDITLNGMTVGASEPGGFFYVDRPAGSYRATTGTETEKSVSFVLAAGETKYLRTYATLGIVVARVVIELVTADDARKDLPSLSYTASPVARLAGSPIASAPNLGNAQQSASPLQSTGDINDAEALPNASLAMKERYRAFLQQPKPRAFAISQSGKNWRQTYGRSRDLSLPSDAGQRAVLLCERASNEPCFLYAVDDYVVYQAHSPQEPKQ